MSKTTDGIIGAKDDPSISLRDFDKAFVAANAATDKFLRELPRSEGNPKALKADTSAAISARAMAQVVLMKALEKFEKAKSVDGEPVKSVDSQDAIFAQAIMSANQSTHAALERALEKEDVMTESNPADLIQKIDDAVVKAIETKGNSPSTPSI